jgi:SAM-dependent methyltransferase
MLLSRRHVIARSIWLRLEQIYRDDARVRGAVSQLDVSDRCQRIGRESGFSTLAAAWAATATGRSSGARRAPSHLISMNARSHVQKKRSKISRQAEVLYKSVYDIDWHDEFDIAFSIGVIHHLAEPRRALQNMVDALKPGGQLLVWVYSYEGNEWIVRYVNPIRKYFTAKLPLALVHVLSYVCSIPLFIFVKTCSVDPRRI